MTRARPRVAVVGAGPSGLYAVVVGRCQSGTRISTTFPVGIGTFRTDEPRRP